MFVVELHITGIFSYFLAFPTVQYFSVLSGWFRFKWNKAVKTFWQEHFDKKQFK